eukprot:2836140-Amphidinium_carterae.1
MSRLIKRLGVSSAASHRHTMCSQIPKHGPTMMSNACHWRLFSEAPHECGDHLGARFKPHEQIAKELAEVSVCISYKMCSKLTMGQGPGPCCQSSWLHPGADVGIDQSTVGMEGSSHCHVDICKMQSKCHCMGWSAAMLCLPRFLKRSTRQAVTCEEMSYGLSPRGTSSEPPSECTGAPAMQRDLRVDQ